MGISIWQLLIVLVIIVLLFGTKKLRNIGADLGSAIKNFRSSVKDGEEDKNDTAPIQNEAQQQVARDKKPEQFIEGEVTAKRREP